MNATEATEFLQRARCRRAAVILFTRQLAMLFRSGVSLVPALEILAVQPDEPALGAVVEEICRQVESGHRLSRALTLAPRVFPEVYVNMVAIGENTGNLAQSLERLADWLEADDTVARRVRRALSYPGFVLLLTAAMSLFLFQAVLPKFAELFTNVDMELPLATRMMLSLVVLVKNPGVWLLYSAGLLALGWWLRDLYRTEYGARMMFGWLLDIPLLGPMLQMATVGRFATAAAALLDAGVPLQNSMRMAAKASGSPLLAADATHLVAAVEEGEKLSVHLERTSQLYPAFLTQMVQAGEESARLGSMLGRVGSFLSQELDTRLQALNAVLEPLLLGVVAAVVGFVLLSVLLPLYSYIGTLA